AGQSGARTAARRGDGPADRPCPGAGRDTVRRSACRPGGPHRHWVGWRAAESRRVARMGRRGLHGEEPTMAKSPVSLLRAASGLVTRPGRGGDRGREAAIARRSADRLLDDPGVDPAIPVVTADDGTPLYTEVRGPAGGVPIVLVHGWSCHGRVWNAQ